MRGISRHIGREGDTDPDDRQTVGILRVSSEVPRRINCGGHLPSGPAPSYAFLVRSTWTESVGLGKREPTSSGWWAAIEGFSLKSRVGSRLAPLSLPAPLCFLYRFHCCRDTVLPLSFGRFLDPTFNRV